MWCFSWIYGGPILRRGWLNLTDKVCPRLLWKKMKADALLSSLEEGACFFS